MNVFQTFEEFLTSQSFQIPVWSFVLNLLLATLLGYILTVVYVRYGTTLSNRRMFSNNFILIAMTTMLIISIVKSSLALSLGLVGALSIVRFRAAIKEPEELAYLFLTIAIGLGMGADQRNITLLAFIIIVAIIYARSISRKKEDTHNLHVTVFTRNPGRGELDRIIGILKEHCSSVNLRRFDEIQDALEASFMVEFSSIEQLTKCKSALRAQNEAIKITFLDNKNIG